MNFARFLEQNYFVARHNEKVIPIKALHKFFSEEADRLYKKNGRDYVLGQIHLLVVLASACERFATYKKDEEILNLLFKRKHRIQKH